MTLPWAIRPAAGAPEGDDHHRHDLHAAGTRSPGDGPRHMTTDHADALVIFGATGDLAKLETFPALVGLVDRGVLDVPVIGVAKSGWGLPQFRGYAAASLKLNGLDPAAPAAAKMLGLLRYVHGDLGDDATYSAVSQEMGPGTHALFDLEGPPPLFARMPGGIESRGPRPRRRVVG